MSPAEAGLRLDLWLAPRNPGITRSQIRRWIDLGRVLVNGVVPKAGYALRASDDVTWEPLPPTSDDEGPPAEKIPVPLIYVDDHIVVVDKPAGMVVHPGAGVPRGTLVGALKGLGLSLAPTGGPFRPGIVHRLDKGTSGLMVVARTDPAYHALVAAIAERRVKRRYRALVWGKVQGESGTVEGAIARSHADRRRMAVVRQGGRPAMTRFKILYKFRFLTDLDLELETGRTHQIRVHLRHLAHPVFGDPEYGGRSRASGLSPADRTLARHWLESIKRQALHARALTFDHPVTGKTLEFEAPLPPDMAGVYEQVSASEGIRHLESGT